MFIPRVFGDDGSVDIGDNIPNSLLLDSSLSQYLSKSSLSSIGTSPYKKTFSFSVKRGKLGVQQCIVGGWRDATSAWFIGFLSSDAINLYSVESNVVVSNKITSAVFRDASAHYDIIVVIDVTLATADDRIQLFINGVRVTSFSTSVNPAQNSVFGAFPLGYTEQNYTLGIGVYPATGLYFDGYISRTIAVDGQALTPSDFGRISADTGQWVPKNYAGTYGTNGFKLDFTNGTALGTDSSGNGNNWTLNGGITSANQYTDTPTNNFAVINPLVNYGYPATLSKGNTKLTGDYGVGYSSFTTGGAGKWYCEITYSAIAAPQTVVAVSDGLNKRNYYRTDGMKVFNSVASAYGASWGVGDVIGISVDVAAGQLCFYKNNVSQGIISTAVSDCSIVTTSLSTSGINTCQFNFGAHPFAYTPPAGFKALCTANLPTPAIIAGANHFKALLDTGANIKSSLVAVFPSYLNWIKDRANANNHQLIDIVRGATAVLQSNTTAAETVYSAPAGSSVGWAWKAGDTTVTNNAGSITSQVSANVQAGFSIVTYTGTGANATVGHGLSKAPGLVIAKPRNVANEWYVYHSALGGTKYLALEGTVAAQANATVFNNTEPTSSVFSIGSAVTANTQVVYCFAEVEGYSKIGSFLGNGLADGPFVYCGFKLRFLLIKRIDVAGVWSMVDTARSNSNMAQELLVANSSAVELATAEVDIVSTGFKYRGASTGAAYDHNVAGGTYIFLALAEAPTKYATAR